MTLGSRVRIKKVTYGTLFVLVIPLMLVIWARATNEIVTLPPLVLPLTGLVITAGGLSILISGMAAIIFYGKGLPMNAFPPEKFVEKNIYRWIPHPIYTGFCAACFGIALTNGSSSGLWLVFPVVVLGCSAIVHGYEKFEIKSRWDTSDYRTLIRLAPDENRKPTVSERLSFYLLVILPSLMLYEMVIFFGVPDNAIRLEFPFEDRLPVIEWTHIAYCLFYPLMIFTPLLMKEAGTLRRLSIAALIGTVIITFFFVTVPVIAPWKGFIPQTFLGEFLLWERSHDSPVAAFPSGHVVFTVIYTYFLAKDLPSYRKILWTIAASISISCATTSMHSIADVISGILVGWLCIRYENARKLLRRLTENMANSWNEWQIGSVRIINHGIYAALGSFTGMTIVLMLAGPDTWGYALVIVTVTIISAGLWAQLIEGSAFLLRSFGYYGGVIGVAAGGVIVHIMNGDSWLMLGAFAIAGTIVQAFGRLRCLVQGCCHGRPSSEYTGIRYNHPRSRVTRLTEFKDVPLHPTPLYSIIWNLLCGIFLLKLWLSGMPPSFIAGLYLILNGLGRFVEEAFRGEPQTLVMGNLRLCQFLSILSVIAGAVITTIPSMPVEAPLEFNFTVLTTSLFAGIVALLAFGVDFPGSHKRSSRLV